jgi:hypothetical protein
VTEPEREASPGLRREKRSELARARKRAKGMEGPENEAGATGWVRDRARREARRVWQRGISCRVSI